ncbi:hypothetical protein [Halobacteriovorax sp. HLS]|uniref:hypothetical protein n=1 Tax=Halobacteriovorax sp. HLS TaxID=2234000 RepID=UPI000FDB0DC4|nr:hypothetical protein [Halobacteriovorax sp. HLS]
MRILVIISCFLSFQNIVFGQKIDESDLLNKDEKNSTLRRRLEPRISDKYYRGRYLIYDCVNRHYVCINLPSFYNCQEERLKEIEAKSVLLSCAPLKQFKTQKECFDVNYSLIHRITNKSFCVNQVF